MSAREFPQLIVGVDRTPSGRAAIRVAVAEAIRRDMPLHAVFARAWFRGPVDDYTHIDLTLTEALGGAVPAGLDVRRAILATPVVTALTARANHPGDLLVIGSGSRGPAHWWRRFWGRSTVQSTLRRARCPVLVVSPTISRRAARLTARGGVS